MRQLPTGSLTNQVEHMEILQNAEDSPIHPGVKGTLYTLGTA